MKLLDQKSPGRCRKNSGNVFCEIIQTLSEAQMWCWSGSLHQLVLQDVDLNLIRPFQGPWIPSTDTEGSNKVIKDSNKPENENRAISFLAQWAYIGIERPYNGLAALSIIEMSASKWNPKKVKVCNQSKNCSL